MRLFTILGKKQTPLEFTLVFPISAIGSFLIIRSEIRAQSFLQLLAILALFILLYHRFLLAKVSKINKTLAFSIEFAPATFLIYLLILSTGGITSQFIVLTHITSLGIVYFLGLTPAIIYSATTIILLLAHLIIDPNGQLLWQDNPYLVVLYFVAYLAIIPFAYLLARYHYFREEWVQNLSKQVTTGKLQQTALLANINDGVIALDKDLKIVLINQATQNLTKYKETELFGKFFFESFSIKDKHGQSIDEQKLPLKILLNSKASVTERGLHISKKDATYFEIDLKVSPVVDSLQNVVGLMLIFKDVTNLTQEERLIDSQTELSFNRFSKIANTSRHELEDLKKQGLSFDPKVKNSLDIVFEKNQELIRFTNDFLLSLKIDAGEISGLVKLTDLYQILEKTLSEVVKISLKDAKINFNPADVSPEFVPIKERKLPAIKRELPVLADPIWLLETLTKIVFASVELSKDNQVDVLVDEHTTEAKIDFIFKVENFPHQRRNDLFKKYYGELVNLPQLVNLSGFEIYIASKLLERIGGMLSCDFETETAKLNFIAQIPRALKKKMIND